MYIYFCRTNVLAGTLGKSFVTLSSSQTAKPSRVVSPRMEACRK
jgi:hypothetical protein